MIGSQDTSMYKMDQEMMEKRKRWSHLRIVRVVVPSGKSAGEGENNQKKEEMYDESNVSWGQNALITRAHLSQGRHMRTYRVGADTLE